MSEWTAQGDCVWGPFEGERHQLIAQCFDGEDKRNARLIAAAPELLEALIAVLGTGLNGGDNVRLALLAAKGSALDDDDLASAEASERALDMARAAIAKAKGEAE